MDLVSGEAFEPVPPSYVAKYELGERRLDVLEFLDIAADIGFDPGEVTRALAIG